MRLFVVALTATMLATGGFGTLPKNPITRAAQQQISENFSDPFLEPVNAYLEQISAPTFESRPRPTNGFIDPVGWILAGLSSRTPEVLPPASTPTFTSVPASLASAHADAYIQPDFNADVHRLSNRHCHDHGYTGLSSPINHPGSNNFL